MFVSVGMTLLFFISVHGVTAMEISSQMPEPMLGFPPLPLGFTDIAKKLMDKCFKLGYPKPAKMTDFPKSPNASSEDNNPFSLFPPLLSSLTSTESLPLFLQNHTMGEEWINWNVTRYLMNCSSLLHTIEVIQNTTEGPQCFMQAFVAPLCWRVLVANWTNLKPMDLDRLLWGAEPYLQNIPLSVLSLPSNLEHPHVAVIMKAFSESFDSLSQDQRVQLLPWFKQVAQNCSLKPKEQPARCSQRTDWLTSNVMEMMGPFLTLLPPSEFQTVSKDQFCLFFQSPKFPDSFRGVGDIPSSLGRTLFNRVKNDCVPNHQQFLQNLGRLGSLACYYGESSSLNASLSMILLSQLNDCKNSEILQMKKELVMKVTSKGEGSLNHEMLKSLGSAVSALTTSQLAKLPESDFLDLDSLPALRTVKWNPAQSQILVQKLLKGNQLISGEKLLSLGSIGQGVSSAVLRKIGSQSLLRTDGLTKLSQELSTLQRSALLEGLRSNMSNTSELVRSIPGPLLSVLSLDTLRKAGMQSLDDLEGRNWTQAQSAFLVRTILGKKLRPKDLGRLGAAVQGVTCEMIDSVNQSDVLDMAQSLVQSGNWLSRTQVGCAAKKLFSSLESGRAGYFSNITEAQLNAIPALLLVHLPPKMISGLPATVCPSFLVKMAQANLSILPASSPSRQALADRALSCLGKNMSALSLDDISSLGPLVCELRASQLSRLAPDALNASLLALATCPLPSRDRRGAIWDLIKATYGDPSDWSSSTMTSLGPLLLMNSSVLNSLPNKPWLKEVLLDILDSLPPAPNPPPPEEFRMQPDLSALYRKLFELTSTPTSARRKRESGWTISTRAPTLLEIENLGEGNLYWSAAQLANISAETFTEGVFFLGRVLNSSPLQLQALRNKTIEVWGPAKSLSELQVLQLGCVARGFLISELQEINITSLDTLEKLSSCNWEYTQMEAVCHGFMNRTNLTARALGPLDILGMGRFVCGLSPEEAGKLNNDTCREAVSALGRLQCSPNVTDQLKERMLDAFGKVENWTEAQVASMGNIIAGLNTSELQSLNPSVLPFITSSAIPLILPARLAALSTSQLQVLGPDNVAMVTETQRSALSEKQRAALGEGLGVPYSAVEVISTPKPLAQATTTAGAPGLGMIGSVVYLQPLLLFLLRCLH